MQFGFGAPVSGPLSGPRDLAQIASEGEALGYDYCTISDHIAIPRDMEAKYPYSDTGEFPGRAGGDRHEQLTVVAYRAVPTKTAYVEPVAVGDDLPGLPIFLTEDEYIPAPLEETYRASWAVFPSDFKELLEPPAGA